MKVSVIIPTYNSKATIKRCVDSVLGQTGAHHVYLIQVIVVDDGSTDQTAEYLQNLYESNSNVIVYSKENGGVSSARNYGIEKATGDYIMFVDADDALAEGLLEALLPIKPEEDLVVGGIVLHQDSGIRNISFEGTYSVQDVIEGYGMEIPGLLLNGPCCKIYRKKLIEEYSIRFDPARSLGEDTLFVFQYLCRCATVRFVDYCGYIYYQLGSSSLMTKYRPEAFFEARDVYSNLIRIVAEVGGTKAVQNMQAAYSNVLLVYLRKTISNRRTISREMLSRILREYLNDAVVQKEAKLTKGKGAVRRMTDVLTYHKSEWLLRVFLTLHVSIRGV